MTLTPYINQQFAAQIWKLDINSHSNLLFAEVRNEENRQVAFTCINLDNGNINFKNLSLPEKWLTGLQGSLNGIMFLHGYQSAQSPAHKGITAINALNGATLWSSYTDAIHLISINGPVTYNTQIQPKKLFLTDASTGKTIRSFDPVADQPVPLDIQIPRIIEHLPPDIDIDVQAVQGDIHYMEYNDLRIVSLHRLSNNMLTQSLHIIDKGVTIYTDLLNDDIQKLQPESFILYRNKLIYIANRTSLKVVDV